MARKNYTKEEMQNIQLKIDNYISTHDRYSIKELCSIEEYAMNYFIQKAMDSIITIEHIKNII